MKQGKYRIRAALFLLSMFLLCGCSYGGNGKVVLTMNIEDDKVFTLEKGNDREECSGEEAEIYLESVISDYTDVVGTDVWKGEHEEELLSRACDMALARLTHVKALCIYAKEKGITLSDEEKEQCAEAARLYLTEKNSSGTELTEELLQKMYEDYLLADKVYRGTISSIETEISDDEALVIRVDSILFSTKDENGNDLPEAEKQDALRRAVEAKAAIDAGESFDEVLNRYNEGDISSYCFGRNYEDQAFAQAAFLLSEGEISDVVETQDGYRIIRCVSAYDRTETDANKVTLLRERRQQAFEEEYDSFAESLDVDLNDRVWDSVREGMDPSADGVSFFKCYSEVFQNSEEALN